MTVTNMSVPNVLLADSRSSDVERYWVGVLRLVQECFDFQNTCPTPATLEAALPRQTGLR